MSTTWAEKQAKIRAMKPAEIAQSMCTNPAAITAVEAAEHTLRDARMAALARLRAENDDDATATREDIDAAVAADPIVLGAVQVLDAAVAALQEDTVEFLFRALARETYEHLVSEHPPTDEQRAAGEAVDKKTFFPALMSACHVYRVQVGVEDDGEPRFEEEPGMTVEDATEILDTWSQGDAQTLVAAVVAVNQVSRLDYVSLGKGSGLTRR
jgi:hypothetical protein